MLELRLKLAVGRLFVGSKARGKPFLKSDALIDVEPDPTAGQTRICGKEHVLIRIDRPTIGKEDLCLIALGGDEPCGERLSPRTPDAVRGRRTEGERRQQNHETKPDTVHASPPSCPSLRHPTDPSSPVPTRMRNGNALGTQRVAGHRREPACRRNIALCELRARARGAPLRVTPPPRAWHPMSPCRITCCQQASCRAAPPWSVAAYRRYDPTATFPQPTGDLTPSPTPRHAQVATAYAAAFSVNRSSQRHRAPAIG